MIGGVLFDKDGTLFDFRRTWEAWAASFLQRLAGGDSDRAKALGIAIGYDVQRQSFEPNSIVIAGTPMEVAGALRPHLHGMDDHEVLTLINAEAEMAPQAEAVPLQPLLGGLRAGGLRLGVATNDAEAPARAHLSRAGVVEMFDFIAGSDSGFGGKPAPGQLLGFADAVGLAPEAVVMVGDSLHDLKAGRAAGMQTVAVLTGLAGTDELAPFADVVLADIGGLPAWIAGRG